MFCFLTCSLDYPLRCLERDTIPHCRERLSRLLDKHSVQSPILVCVVCRRGNDSQLAVRKLKSQSDSLFGGVAMEIKDIIGGLTEWSDAVDQTFPKYWCYVCVTLAGGVLYWGSYNYIAVVETRVVSTIEGVVRVLISVKLSLIKTKHPCAQNNKQIN